MSQTTRQHAARLIDRLKELDSLIHGAFFEMGQILSAISHGKLFEILGYDSMGEMIDEELSVSRSQAFRYLYMYRDFKRLGYTTNEALNLIHEFSFTHMARYLRTAKRKVGKRAIRTAIDKQVTEARQINFQINKDDHELLLRVLRKYGAEEVDGRVMNSSSALIALARAVDERPSLRLVG